MKQYPFQSRLANWPALLTLALVLSASPADAQTAMKPAGGGGTIQDSTSKKPAWINDVGIDQKLSAQIPLDAAFRDDFGQPVTLGTYLGEGKTRPAILVLVYYGCPRLCTMVLNEMNKAMTPMSLNPGSDFEIIVVSFDPKETPELAAKKKIEYTRWYNRPKTNGGWHFLTGDQANIKKLTDSVGFRYTWDEKHSQFIHAGGIMVLTPGGQVSKYFYGTQYTPRDLKASLIDASGGKIGTVGDAILQYCFEYDPHTGRYSFAILRIVQICGGLTVLALGTFVFLNFRRGRSAAVAAVPTGEGSDGPETGDAEARASAGTGEHESPVDGSGTKS